MAITIHPELQSFIYPLTPEELQQLEANLLAEGCRDPLVIWREEEVLLDGHNRHMLCAKHGITFEVVNVPLPDLDAAKAWMVNNQLGRRNLTPDQTSYLRGKQYELQKRQGTRTDLTSGNSYQKSHNTATELAQHHKVSEKTIRNDAVYAKAIDTLADVAGPEARQALLSRETKVTQKEVKALAKVAMKDTHTAREALDAVHGVKTPKQAKQVVREAARKVREHEQYMEAMTRSEGLAEWPPPPKAAVPSDGLAVRFRQILRSMEVLHTCLRMVTLPDALDPHTEPSVRLAKVCQQVVQTLTEHPVVREALYPPPAPPTVNAAGARSSGVLRDAVLAMAERQRRFTPAALAQALNEETKAVWQVLERLCKQQVVRCKGKEYVYLGKGASGDDQKNQVLKNVERKLNAALRQLQIPAPAPTERS
jgi:hypothetical protein